MSRTVFAISGSLRAASYNTALLRAAAEVAPAGWTWAFADLRPLPFYDGDVEAAGAPEVVLALWEAVRTADLLVIATPEYNHGPSGVLKNAIDWISRARPSVLAGKPTVLFGASTGVVGTARAQVQLRENLSSNRVRLLPVPEVLVGRAQDKVDAEGRLTDEGTRAFLGKVLAEADALLGA